MKFYTKKNNLKIVNRTIITLCVFAALAVMANLNGCHKEPIETPPPPCTSPDCSSDYDKLVQNKWKLIQNFESEMYESDFMYYQEYLRNIFTSDQELFKKLAVIADHPIYRELKLLGDKQPIWKNTPRVHNGNLQPGYLYKSIGNFYEAHKKEFATHEPGNWSTNTTPQLTPRQKELSHAK